MYGSRADHPHGSIGLAGLVIATGDVEEAAQRFARFTGRPATSSPLGRTVHLDRGRLELVIMTAQTFTAVLPEIGIPGLPFIGAYALIVRSLGHADTTLRRGGLQPRCVRAALAVPFPAALGHGVWLFTQNAAELPWTG
jgi:hypothetical protein